MSRSIDKFKGKEYPNKYRRLQTKSERDKKKFVWAGEGWATKAQGGDGNKRGWGGANKTTGNGMGHGYPKWLYKRKKQGFYEN